MKKSVFVKRVLDGLPGFASHDTYFYLSPNEEILSGFCCEMTPHGAYVWRFVYPLFDKFQSFHLSYSQRLSGEQGYIDFSTTSRSQLAAEFLSRIEPVIAACKETVTLLQFISHFEEHGLGANPRLYLILGYAKVLAGERDEALVILQNASENLNGSSLTDCQEIFNLLQADMVLASNRILAYANEMSRALHLV